MRGEEAREGISSWPRGRAQIHPQKRDKCWGKRSWASKILDRTILDSISNNGLEDLGNAEREAAAWEWPWRVLGWGSGNRMEIKTEGVGNTGGQDSKRGWDSRTVERDVESQRKKSERGKGMSQG